MINLESWERPKEYRLIEKIPRSTAGKIDYKALEQMVTNVKSEEDFV